MTKERFIEILNNKDNEGLTLIINNSCPVMLGLKIIEKYCPKKGIEGADRDIVYSVDITDLISGGIIEDDVRELNALGWFIEDNEYLAIHV